MFDNLGGKLKILAIVVLVFGIIGSIMGSVQLSSIEVQVSYHSSEHPYASLGIAVLIVGCLSSYITSILLYGFGDLLDDSRTIQSRLASLDYEISSLKIKLASKEVPGLDSSHTNDNQTVSVSNSASTASDAIELEQSSKMLFNEVKDTPERAKMLNGKIYVNRSLPNTVCPYCGTRQSSKNEKCESCNSVFENA